MYIFVFSDLCEAHLRVRTTELMVPCVSHDLVAAWLSFTVIVSQVQYKHTRPGMAGVRLYSLIILLLCGAAAAAAACVVCV